MGLGCWTVHRRVKDCLPLPLQFASVMNLANARARVPTGDSPATRHSKRWRITVHAMSGSFPGARVVISEDDMGLSVDPCMADDAPFPDAVRFFVGQLEREAATGAMHVQAYIEMETKRSMEQMREDLVPIFGWALSKRCHIEMASGTRKDNEECCSREDTRMKGTSVLKFARGESTRSNAQSDRARRRMDGVVMAYDIAAKHQGNVASAQVELYEDLVRARGSGDTERYEVLFHCLGELSKNRGLEAFGKRASRKRKYEGDSSEGVGVRRIQVVVLLGPHGTGKTMEVYRRYTGAVYRVTPYSRFQCDYDPQMHKVILLDNYVGETGKGAFFTADMLRSLCEGYPMRWESKHKPGGVALEHLVLAVTTNTHPLQWFDDYKGMPHETKCSVISRIPESCIERFEGPDRRALSEKANYTDLFKPVEPRIVAPAAGKQPFEQREKTPCYFVVEDCV